MLVVGLADRPQLDAVGVIANDILDCRCGECSTKSFTGFYLMWAIVEGETRYDCVKYFHLTEELCFAMRDSK